MKKVSTYPLHEKVPALKTAKFFASRTAEADIEAGLRLLKRSGGQAPRSDDMLR